MKKFLFYLFFIASLSPLSWAEFNIVNNDDRPVYIDQGYRNVLNSFFLFVNNDSEDYLRKNKFSFPYENFTLKFKPSVLNNNKIKGDKYYFTNYEVIVSLKNKDYKLPLVIADVDTIGSSIIYNDEKISIFSIESYSNPVSNNRTKNFKSEIYIVNKLNFGFYNPIFLSLSTDLKNSNEIPLKFSRLKSIHYEKNNQSYKIVYEVQKALEDFSVTGKVLYQKKPLIYSFNLKLDKKEPFIVSNFVEKSEGTHKVIKSNGYEQMYMDFLSKTK
ncbi:hypothetical protein G9F32_15090 [Acinetobacter sp. 194]|uniref:hypothetical protein n=1 Tax=Acinetobacter shaoyimingii TaxID=2715164 RepID=UPI0014080C59|nr:hypothetical protein [Acinetobacter shaoyimingii]NHB59323.1 hypothetical protein [Acinetobacter shaoyimingii]